MFLLVQATIKCYRKLVGWLWILLMSEDLNWGRTLLESVDYFLKVDQKNRDIELGCFSWWGLTPPHEDLKFSRDPWFFLKIKNERPPLFSATESSPFFLGTGSLFEHQIRLLLGFSKGKLLGSAGDTTAAASPSGALSTAIEIEGQNQVIYGNWIFCGINLFFGIFKKKYILFHHWRPAMSANNPSDLQLTVLPAGFSFVMTLSDSIVVIVAWVW